jgi:hypothetical protein
MKRTRAISRTNRITRTSDVVRPLNNTNTYPLRWFDYVSIAVEA